MLSLIADDPSAVECLKDSTELRQIVMWALAFSRRPNIRSRSRSNTRSRTVVPGSTIGCSGISIQW